MSPSLVYRRLRAPREDRGLLLEPSFPEVLTLAKSNRQRIDGFNFEVAGTSFQTLRHQAREELLRLALVYTRQYVDVDAQLLSDAPLIVSGHQPALFHPGVWAKNFFIDRVAKALNGHAIQVVIDNDVFRSHSILCPTGSYDEPMVVAESFDDHQKPLPYEMRYVKNETVFTTFADRVAARVAPFVANPLIRQLWPKVVENSRDGKTLGAAIAAARHCIERELGLHTLEVPLSQLCETNAFRSFAVQWLTNAKSYRDIYNSRLQEYRKVHRIKNHAQPLPNLEQKGEWVETPFWIWTDELPTRSAAWIRSTPNGLELANEHQTLNEHLPRNVSAVQQLRQLAAVGLRLRPRALATTTYLRLFLSDTFIHGIGGAKYDQVTDQIVHDIFGVQPPSFAVLSLTALLPSPQPLVGHREIIHKRMQIREMHFHPETFFDSELMSRPQVSSKVEFKKKLLKEKPLRGKAGEWHRQLAANNGELRGFLQEKTAKEEKNLSQLLGCQRASSVFSSREWSFCLFDGEFLRDRLLDLNYIDS